MVDRKEKYKFDLGVKVLKTMTTFRADSKYSLL